MRITLCFDVEDYLTPEEMKLDDLVMRLCETMTDGGIQGTLFLIGEKARCLRERGRKDVIAALRKHDIGGHTNMGSIHPTVTERMEHSDWSDGVARMLADEIVGMNEISEIIGKSASSLARHGGSYSPQLVNALGKIGKPFVYSPIQIPGHHITWFCNNLSFYACVGGAFQDKYFTAESLEKGEKFFYQMVEKYKDFEWVGVFHSHPCAIKMDAFICKNYYKGIFTPPEKCVIPNTRNNYDEKALFENFAKHIQNLKADKHLNITTIADMTAEFGSQARHADSAELRYLAEKAAKADGPFYTDRFTAAEIVDFLARAYLSKAETGELPARLPRRDVLGPTKMPLSVPSANTLNKEALKRMATGINVAIEYSGMLPSVLRTGEGTIGSMGEIGIGSALVALGQALMSKEPDAVVKPIPTAPTLSGFDHVYDELKSYQSWNPHRQDLDIADIWRHTQLQTWTIKPAWDSVPEFSL